MNIFLNLLIFLFKIIIYIIAIDLLILIFIVGILYILIHSNKSDDNDENNL